VKNFLQGKIRWKLNFFKRLRWTGTRLLAGRKTEAKLDAEPVGGIIVLEADDEAAKLQVPQGELATAVCHLAGLGELRDFCVALGPGVFVGFIEETFQDGRLALAEAVLPLDSLNPRGSAGAG